MKINKITVLHGKGGEILLIALFSVAARAEDSTNKLDYNLFNPTPTNLMRSFNTERPSKTDAPFTVDAGHVQLETDFACLTHNSKSGVRVNNWQAADNMNFMVGILADLDFELIFGNYTHVASFDEKSNRLYIGNGFGDTTARLNYNLFGDDGGCAALSVMPYLKCPTATGSMGNGAFEGGVNLPSAFNLPLGLTLGVETGAGIFRNDDNRGNSAGFNNSATVSRKIYGPLQGYGEFFSSVSSRARAPWVGTADFGLIYQLTGNVTLDLNTAVGVTRGANDYSVFSGVAVRF